MDASTGSERFLGWTGHDADELAIRKLRAMRRLVLMTLAFESWTALRYSPYTDSPGRHAAIAAALSVCALIGWRDRFAFPAVVGALILEIATVVSVFPENGNHQFLAIVLLVLISLAFSKAGGESNAGGTTGWRVVARDGRAAVSAMRWVVLIGLAWSGVMKLRYGLWFGGEYLSYRIATDPGFARVFAAILPAAEWARLVGLENQIGAGPFRAQAPLLVVISNLTWLAEIALPIGLLVPRTRTFALLAALALMVAIQVGAREFLFAGIMVGGLLLFARRDRVSAFLPVAFLCYFLWLIWPVLARQLGMGGGA